jgi:hypothetical protein
VLLGLLGVVHHGLSGRAAPQVSRRTLIGESFDEARLAAKERGVRRDTSEQLVIAKRRVLYPNLNAVAG